MTRYLTLDLVRGLCAIAVASYHFMSWNYGITIESAGAFGVYIFFILSALAMMIAHSDSFATTIDASRLKHFFVKRLARITPLLALVAAVMFLRAILRGQPIDSALPQAFLTASAGFALHLPGYLSNAVGAWSLGIEALFYVLFPLIAIAVATSSIRALAYTTVLLVVSQQLLMWLIRPFDQPDHWYFYATPITFAPFFAYGIWVWKIGPAQSIAAFWVCLLALCVVLGFSFFDESDIYRSASVYLGLSIISVGVVLAAYRARCPKILSRFALWIGNISYAFYLTHWFGNKVVLWVAAQLGAVSVIVHYAVFIVFMLIVATGIHLFFELPAKRRILRLLDTPKSSKPFLNTTS